MELSELDEDETLALVALTRAIVLGDQRVSAAEAETVPRIIEGLGYAAYQRAVTAALSRFPDEPSLQSFLPTIRRPEARSLIESTLRRLAKSDGVVPSEERILDWLAAAWRR
jgi:hypothetical protein